MTLGQCMGAAYSEVEYYFRDGRIDQTDWDLYRFYWRNGAFRLSGEARMYEIRPEGATWDWGQCEWVYPGSLDPADVVPMTRVTHKVVR